MHKYGPNLDGSYQNWTIQSGLDFLRGYKSNKTSILIFFYFKVQLHHIGNEGEKRYHQNNPFEADKRSPTQLPASILFKCIL